MNFCYQKKDLETAEKYAESARKMDSYNPAAFVNSGVIEFYKEKYDVAKFMFTNALEIDSTLFEALYNNGKVYIIFVHWTPLQIPLFRTIAQEDWRL